MIMDYKLNLLLALIYKMIIAIILLLPGCNDGIISPPEEPLFTKELTGRVILENQTEHSNALVYLDSLNRGVSTDSSGYYSLRFSDADSIHNGVYTIYYFLNDFEKDSAQYVLVNGQVKLDSLDVDSEGNLPLKQLEQLVLVEGWTDKKEYRMGDTIEFKARFTNLTNRIIHIFIPSIFNQLGHVFLYNEKYASFFISPIDPVAAERDIDIYPSGYYEGTVRYTIPEGNPGATGFRPLLLDEYIVATGFIIEGRTLNHLESKFYKYIVEEWYKIHRGSSPKLDWFPNKYRFPHIRIVE